MIELRTLGAAELEEKHGSETRPIAIQAKRLALVTYLALADGHYRRRDSVVALFWPELDDEHSRGALRQALTYLRRTLGTGVIVSRGEEEIAVATDVFHCDAVRFAEAADTGRFEEAMALYGGAFLDGLFVSDGSAELEQWVAEERTRLQRAAARCAWTLAESSLSLGDRAAATSWARRGAMLAPDDESRLRWLVALHDSLGDRAGAVDAYERFARRLEAEYGAQPAAETQALMRAVRERDVAVEQPVFAGVVARSTSRDGRNASPRRHGVLLGAVGLAVLAVGALLAGPGGSLRAFHADSVRARSIVAPSQHERRVDSAYVRGRYWLSKRGAGLLRSLQYFTAALDEDPTFAPAYAGMADAYVQLGYASSLRPDDAFPKARAAAERALALDSALAEPHATLGFVHFYYDREWADAEREFRRALAIDSTYATAHEWYGLYLAAMGRFDEAVAHESRAQQLDPLSVAISGTAAWVLYYAGRPLDADRALRVTLRSDSTFALGRFYLGRVMEEEGQLDSALIEYRAAVPLQDWVPTVAAVGNVYGRLGRPTDAMATLHRLDSLSRSRYVSAYAYALVYVGIGQRDSAFAWLERSAVERTNWIVWLRRDPRWAPLRSDSRFTALATRLRLPP